MRDFRIRVTDSIYGISSVTRRAGSLRTALGRLHHTVLPRTTKGRLVSIVATDLGPSQREECSGCRGTGNRPHGVPCDLCRSRGWLYVELAG